MEGQHRLRRDPGSELIDPNRQRQAVIVGLHAGGGVFEKPEVEAAVRELSRATRELPVPSDDDLSINLVFDIPGSIWKPSYEGVRTGRFSSVEKMLLVEIAVPDELKPQDVPATLPVLLRESMELANSYVKRRRLPFSTHAIITATEHLLARAAHMTADSLRKLGNEYAARVLADTERMVQDSKDRDSNRAPRE